MRWHLNSQHFLFFLILVYLTVNNVWRFVVICRDDLSSGCLQEQERKHCRGVHKDVGRTNLTVAACSHCKNSTVWFFSLSVYFTDLLLWQRTGDPINSVK